ncbi:MAG: heme lyase CcmF/NrfE family subunit [Chloroflexi bacterium]|nr:MAG: heme lyase CcmF/NrfE family subunit [Chloroflexota bacterium]
MLAEVGLASVFLAFVAALYAIVVSIYGAQTHSNKFVTSARNAAVLTFPLLLISAVALVTGLITEQYQMQYVWSTTSPDMPLIFRISALWGSQAGSILFWSLLMSAFTAAALLINWHSHRRLMPYVITYTMAVLAFFLGLTLFLENPFQRIWLVGSEVAQTTFIPAGAVPPSAAQLADTANGLNPLLRHFGMVIHPPMLYLGFVGFVIPFAFAMAALASGDLSTNWIKATRRYSLIAWLFLSLGLILGGRWAYDVLGWGGYWGWDPVENAAFLPWLMGTAFLHSVMIQEKRGMLKLWNMILVIGTFSAVIFGTFATRSGLVDSVHAFARSQIGFPMFFFWATVTLISSALILWRWNRGELRDEHAFTNILSRETLFVLNNLIFVLLFIAIFWGSFGAPVISELFLETEITLGVDYFNRVTPPLFLAMFVLMGVAPVSAWGATSLRRLGRAVTVPLMLTVGFIVLVIVFGVTQLEPIAAYAIVAFAGFVALHETFRGVRARVNGLKENWLQAMLALYARNRRRYGGYVVHLGIAIIGIGIIGSTVFQTGTQQTLAVGESLDINGYQMRFNGLEAGQISGDGRIMDIANVTVSRDGRTLANLRPRRDFFPTVTNGPNSMTIAGAYSTIENDFYVLLVGWEEINANNATFKVYINPLVNLVWWGGIVLILGTFIAAWPTETVPAYVRERSRGRRDKFAGAVA